MVLRLHVRMLYKALAKNLYALLVFSVSTNLDEGKKFPSCSGIWNRMLVDLNRYGWGSGEGDDAVYANTFEGCTL